MPAIFLGLSASLFNFWIYWIFEYNFFLGELLVIESVLLYLSFLRKKNQVLLILIVIILTLTGSFLLVNHFDKNIFSVSEVESIRIRERQEYFAKELGQIYKNRVGILYFDHLRLPFSKISDNFFSALDLGLYFSPGALIDQAKFPILLAPIFIIGLLFLIREIKSIQIVYLLAALLISTFTKPDSKLGPLLMFPFVSLCLLIGLNRLIKIIKIGKTTR